ncbi:3-keto-5-aminohexanoate cleavage protein [Psychrobacillus soli]|uniref:3-keto-5-aminohexanoate cleavage protein n=1 Tax=Psychrobacillus soli TaxID=1543965 RepID=A0A544TDR0_9BACI|nr:3-keto-5-aminohexanoate cleavage protein [Psychrobacillus soli]TQR15594.1 3-keto-5-aminohexanoate cleavage protein [Psychrobacillus soli]
MNNDVIITCALTGSGDSAHKSEFVPVTPQQIADSAVKAAKAGAAIVHVHVRDPKTKNYSKELSLYEETARLIRDSGVDMILNITAGMGADFVPDPENPSVGGPGTDMITPAERIAHIVKIKPEITTLDCGSMNYATTSYIATMDMLRETARGLLEAQVKPEIEVFELGHIWQAKQLMKEGLIEDYPTFQLCMGVPYGAEATQQNMIAMLHALPPNVNWSSFSIGRNQMPWVAQSVLMGGNVRVGLEDNIYLGKGHLATNEELVENAKEIVERMGARILSPKEAREKLKIQAKQYI